MNSSHPIFKRSLQVVLAACCSAAIAFAASSVYDFSLKSIDGVPSPLGAYKGKVIMVVNVASKCRYTDQYAALEALYEKFKDQGFVILGFPANNFGEQEPGTNAEIKTFCSSKYKVTFPMYSKISVKGDDTAPLYRYLTTAKGGEIQWNFTKFLVDRHGKIQNRFEPAVPPDAPALMAAVQAACKLK